MPKKSKGGIFVISAPSGAGKTTLCRLLLATVDNLGESVSYTTRQPRKGEKDGVDYTFIPEEKFRKMVDRQEFVEWAEVHGHLYGTSRRRLISLMNSGVDVLLDIDIQGARQIRDTFGEGVFIFVLPPSMEVLRERIEKRGGNTKEDIERRLRRAAEEIRGYKLYDYVIVNDVLKSSAKKLEAIITAERLRSKRVDTRWIKQNILS